MSKAAPREPRPGFLGKLTRNFNIRLLGAAGGLLLALLIAPVSRRLFLAQAGIAMPVPGNLVSLSGSQLGIQHDPFYSRIAYQTAHAVGEQYPDDLQIQLADAVAVSSEDGNAVSNPSVQKVRRLRGLRGRFHDRPALYANILRYEAMGQVQAHHDTEQYGLAGDPPPTQTNRRESQKIDTAEYLAYDQDAAAGERLDPDNSYFPLMRAVGLFGMNRDSEALAAIARAGQKTQWREYYNEEIRGQWRLQDAAFINNSVLFHALSAAATLFPQYARMRGAIRVTVYTAMQAERAGHIQEGLTLRRDVMRVGSLMRARSSSLIGSLVGNAIAETAIARPGGGPAVKINSRNELDGRARQRRAFDAYLQETGNVAAQSEFHAAQQAGDAIGEYGHFAETSGTFDQPLQNLLGWWIAGLVTLSNILWLLILGGIAALCLRYPTVKAGLALPTWTRLALPLGLLGGAFVVPSLLTEGMSPYVNQITGEMKLTFLLVGLMPVLLLPALPAATMQDRVRRLYAFACGMPIGAALALFYVWQGRGIVTMAYISQIICNLSSANSSAALSLRIGLLWFTPGASILLLLATTILSRVSRVPISVGVARAFRGLALPISAALFLLYGGILLFTLRTEAQVQYSLERTLDNEGQYIAELSGKSPARSDATR